MKSILFFSIFLLSIVSDSYAQEGKVTFVFRNKSANMGLIIFRNSQDIEGGLPPFSLSVNKTRKLNIPCPLLFYTADKNAVPIFARPGDSIVITKNNEKLEFDVNGQDRVRGNEQALLLELFKQFGPLYGPEKREAVYKESNKEAYIKEIFQKKIALIDAYQKKSHLSASFESFLKNYFFYLQLNLLIRERTLAGKDPSYILRGLHDEFPEIDWGSDKDPTLLQVDTYMAFIGAVASLQAKINPSVPQRMRNLTTCFSGNSRNFALFQEIKKMTSSGGDSSQTAFTIFYKNCTDSRYKAIATGEKRLKDDVAGASGSDLLLLADDHTIPLKSILETKFANKIVVIDFWASWCTPCVKEFPFYEKLVSKYKTDSTIVFVFISMDKTRNDWLTATPKYRVLDKSNSYLLANNFKSLFAGQYNINSIPRTMVMYQNNMYAMDAPRPSDGGKLEAIIKDLKKNKAVK